MAEEHKFQFRGVWIPHYVCDLIAAGRLSWTEAGLLAMVDGLSKRNGCTATNAYFGRLLGLEERQIRNLLRTLKGLGLLKQCSEPGEPRVLTVAWDRPEGTAEPPNGGGNYLPGGGNALPGGRQCVAANTKAITQPPVSDGELEALLGDTPASLPPTPPSMGLFPNPPRVGEEYLALAYRLYSALKEHGKVLRDPSMEEWAHDFRRLLTVDKVPAARVAGVLDWYCGHFRDRFVPLAFSAATFRRRFLDIEAAMERAAAKAADQGIPLTPVVVGQEVRKLEATGRWAFPAEIDRDTVLAVAQQTLDTIRQHIKDMRALTPHPQDVHLWKHLLHTAPQPLEFVSGWMQRLADYANRGGLVPPFTRYAATTTHNQFQRLWFQRARQYDPRGVGPDRLWKMLTNGGGDAGEGTD